MSVVGIDSRTFERNSIKHGKPCHFESIIGIAIRIDDYVEFDALYQKAIKQAFSEVGCETDYMYYCWNDLRNLEKGHEILEIFAREISKAVAVVHVFYTLFSKTRQPEVKAYGRYAKNRKIKLSSPTISYEKLRSQFLSQYFPAVCAWRLMNFFTKSVQFHFDAYGGHICEAEEQLEASGFTRLVYPNGDCSNPVISTADLLLELLDKRLADGQRTLIFDNIRPSLPEFGEKVLVYPILGKHLHFINPIDKKPIDTIQSIKHPVFWVFKGSEAINTGAFRVSKSYRNLIDYAASQGCVVKMFDKNRDIEYFKEGDYGVYINTQGKEIIDTYRKIGKRFIPFNLDLMVPDTLKQ